MQYEENLLVQSIYENYGWLLKKLALGRGVSLDDAEDLIQDTIVSYYLRYDLHLPEEKKLALLGKILINSSIDLYRKNKRYEFVELNSEIDESEILMNQRTDEDGLQHVVKEEAYIAMRDCIYGMKKIWRDVTILHMVEGRPEREVAKILDITETTCRSRISRARKYMRLMLGDWLKS